MAHMDPLHDENTNVPGCGLVVAVGAIVSVGLKVAVAVVVVVGRWVGVFVKDGEIVAEGSRVV